MFLMWWCWWWSFDDVEKSQKTAFFERVEKGPKIVFFDDFEVLEIRVRFWRVMSMSMMCVKFDELMKSDEFDDVCKKCEIWRVFEDHEKVWFLTIFDDFDVYEVYEFLCDE